MSLSSQKKRAAPGMVAFFAFHGSFSVISIYPRNHPNQTCGYWLITPNQQTLCIETDYILTVGNYISASEKLQNSGQLQNNCTILIAISRVITSEMLRLQFHENNFRIHENFCGVATLS